MSSHYDYPQVAAIILAAGKGTRMQSSLPKVLHTIADKPLVQHTLDKLNELNLGETLLVIGYQSDSVKKTLGKHLNYVHQKEQLGTGHAVLQALPSIPHDINTIMVLNGDDSVFYRIETLNKIIDQHLKSGAKMTILTSIQENVEISGRVIRDEAGFITGIKANSRLSEEELAKNNEMVCGLYLFDRRWLEKELPKVEISPKREYNITGLIEVAMKSSTLQDLQLDNPDEWQSVNTQNELQKARLLWQKLHK